MKKHMKVIFFISVLFIICVGLFGVIHGEHKFGENISDYNWISKETAQSKETQKSDQNSKSGVLNGSTADNTQSKEDTTKESNSEEDSASELRAIAESDKTEKQQYLDRLDSIVSYYEELWKKSDSLGTVGMKELKSQEYTKWDDELNTIYQLIKKKLSEEEFIPIRDEERQWIDSRDKQAALAASESAGGTMEGLEYMAVMTNVTKERTYELVDIYFEE